MLATPAAPLRCHLMETTRGRARNADDGIYFNVALVARRTRRLGARLQGNAMWTAPEIIDVISRLSPTYSTYPLCLG